MGNYIRPDISRRLKLYFLLKHKLTFYEHLLQNYIRTLNLTVNHTPTQKLFHIYYFENGF